MNLQNHGRLPKKCIFFGNHPLFSDPLGTDLTVVFSSLPFFSPAQASFISDASNVADSLPPSDFCAA